MAFVGATLYFLQYTGGQSRLFITGLANETSETPTSKGLMYTCNHAFVYDSSKTTLVDAMHCIAPGSSLVLALKLCDFDMPNRRGLATAKRVHSAVEREITSILFPLEIKSEAAWTMAALRELQKKERFALNLSMLPRLINDAIQRYQMTGRVVFWDSEEL